MSLHSTLESVGASSLGSPSSSQQQQIFVSTTRVKNQHLSLAQMRGVIQIFNHYFPKNPKKRMNKDEKNRKWTSYKNRIYREYKRIITGKYSSEKALVKRYSEPLAFLKYKLKQSMISYAVYFWYMPWWSHIVAYLYATMATLCSLFLCHEGYTL